MNMSVVICVRNESSRIEACLETVLKNNPDEIIVVDGNSSDDTVEKVSRYRGIRVIVSKNSTLTRDRQLGIDACKFPFIAMIDADHRLGSNGLQSLLTDLEKYDLDIVQASLCADKDSGFWAIAEGQAWELFHNRPGERQMIGTAPCVYKRKIFEHVKFDDNITKTIDDTDFIFRLSSCQRFRVGIGDTVVCQIHFNSFKSFIREFLWYGKGDAEFCCKHPSRAMSMIFHLLIRYPLLRAVHATLCGRFYAAGFCIFQGIFRFFGLLGYFINRPKK